MDEFCPFVGHVLGIKGFFIEKMSKVRAAAFEEEGIEGLARDAGDPAKVKA